MNKIFQDPLFILGLLIRLSLLALVFPDAASSWYIPFLESTAQNFSFDPWKIFLANGGSNVAFPYGYSMWIAFLPSVLFCHFFKINLYFGYGITLLITDICLLFILKALSNTNNKLLIWAYWLSPIVIFATYWLGLNDLIPVAILCLALHFLRSLRPIQAGVLCGLAISAKLSMILTTPFFCIYLYRNQALRLFLSQYIFGLLIITLLFGLPFLHSKAGMNMLMHNPEIDKIYQLKLYIGQYFFIYILPCIYLFMLYYAWHVRRINFELFNALFGLAFFLVVLLTPASPGWFIWLIPTLLLYQAKQGKVAILLVSTFTFLYVTTSFLSMPLPQIINTFTNKLHISLNNALGIKGFAILSTILFSTGIILVLRIWQDMVKSNDYFRLSRKPFIIGIAGDSGAGKDTLSDSLIGLFGSHSVTFLSGDDYHLWDRQKPIWRVITHLNPQANNLEQFSHDLLTLADSKTIYSRHYNHDTGRMTTPYKVKSNDFIIASGLHSLYLPSIRKCYDLSIYLDIDENLRRYFKLKRDVSLRGYSIERVLMSLNERDEDSKKFIKPQLNHADLIFSLQPIHPRLIENIETNTVPRLKLAVCSRRSLNDESLLRVLIGICGLHVDRKISHDSKEVALIIEGETTADDIALAAKKLLPRITEFLDILPKWEDGIRGLMQLIVLSHINQSLSERLI